MTETTPDIPGTDTAALKALLARAHDEVANIAEGKRRWTMSIPAKPETDSDLLISSALTGAEKALSALAAAREELARYGTNAELLACSTMGEAFDRMEQTVRERDAARAEADRERTIANDLRKTIGEREAEADKLRAELAEARKVIACRDAALDASTETHRIAQQIVLATLGAVPAAAPQADDLPGMWEAADLTGGLTDAVPGDGEQAATTPPACICLMRGGKHSFRCDLSRNGRPPYDPSAVASARPETTGNNGTVTP